MKKYIPYIIIVILIIVSIVILLNLKISKKEYKNNYFSITYDTTWKKVSNKDGLLLEHKKTKSTLTIKTKELEDKYFSTKLSDITEDIIYSIKEENKSYKEISSNTNEDGSISYLFESEDTNTLVRIYKQDNLLLIAYYEAKIEDFDAVLDSVDSALNTLKLTPGIKID